MTERNKLWKRRARDLNVSPLFTLQGTRRLATNIARRAVVHPNICFRTWNTILSCPGEETPSEHASVACWCFSSSKNRVSLFCLSWTDRVDRITSFKDSNVGMNCTGGERERIKGTSSTRRSWRSCPPRQNSWGGSCDGIERIVHGKVGRCWDGCPRGAGQVLKIFAEEIWL